jgi:hypothetical protein
MTLLNENFEILQVRVSKLKHCILYLLGCIAVKSGRILQTFRKYVLHPSSGWTLCQERLFTCLAYSPIRRQCSPQSPLWEPQIKHCILHCFYLHYTTFTASHTFFISLVLYNNKIKYCNVDGQSVAKQRIGKQTSTIGKLCFLCGPCRTKARWYRKYIARHGTGKHASTTMGDGVLRGVRANELS